MLKRIKRSSRSLIIPVLSGLLVAGGVRAAELYYDFDTSEYVVNEAQRFIGALSITGNTTLTGDFTANNNFHINASNGRVGIGTTSPVEALDVAGNIRTVGSSYAFTINPSHGNGPRLQLGSTSNPSLFFEIGSWNNINNFDSKNRSLSFYTSGNANQLYLATGGNVGVGTSSPSNLFHVDGGTGIVGRFSGRVIGGDAVNANEFATLGQVTGAIGSASHDPVTLAGQNYLTLSNQQITANAINLSGSHVTGTLGIANGGTGATTFGTERLIFGVGIGQNASSTGSGSILWREAQKELSVYGPNWDVGAATIKWLGDNYEDLFIKAGYTSDSGNPPPGNIYITPGATQGGGVIALAHDGVSRIGSVGIGTASPTYIFDVAGGTGIVGRFSGRVIGGDAVNADEFVTLSQLQGATGSGNIGVESLNALTGNVTINGDAMVNVAKVGQNLNLSLSDNSITGAKVANSTITNNKLANDSITINTSGALTGGGSVALGGSLSLSVNTGGGSGGLGSTFFAQGGNAFGATAVLGTTDNNALQIRTNNQSRIGITAAGNVGIGTLSPSQTLTVDGTGAFSNTLYASGGLHIPATATNLFGGSMNVVYANWGSSNHTSGDTNGKWIKVAEFTLNGSYSSMRMSVGNGGRRSGGSGEGHPFEMYIQARNTTSGVESPSTVWLQSPVTRSASVRDARLIHRSGSGITNNKFEVWIQFGANWQDGFPVEVDYWGTGTMDWLARTTQPQEVAIPTGFVSEFQINSYARVNERLAIGNFFSNPTLSLSIGDTDTGLNWVSEDNLAIVTGGTERMFFSSSGNVGIGTSPTAPAEKLQVVGNIALGVSNAGGGRTLQFNAVGGGSHSINFGEGTTPDQMNIFYDGTATAPDNLLKIRSQTTDLVTFAQGGNVGIGTNTPGHLLDVSGGTGIVGRFSGRVIGADAVNANEFATLGQVTGAIGSASHDPVTLAGQNYLTLSNQQITAGAINLGGSHVTGTLGIANGGTGATTAGGALTNLGGVPTTRTITAGAGLTGGGNLSADRTLAVNFGTATGTVAQGNDSRILNGQTAYGWGDHSVAGYLTSTSIDTSAKIAAIVGDETGTGVLVFNTNPVFAGNVRMAASSYLNWGGTAGASGYGFRDNAGTMEYKDSSGSWSAFSAGGTVTSVSGSGGSTGLTLGGGPITSTGTLTLGGTLSLGSGGTGATTAAGARGNLGATTVGSNLFTLSNPSAISFLRINANNTVDALSATDFRTAIGAGTGSGSGSVTSVNVSGGTTGISFTGGPITSSGTMTMSGTLTVANGGTGATTLTGVAVGNGTSAMTAVSGTSNQILRRNSGNTAYEFATVSPVITLGGDLAGNTTLTNLGNGTLTATIANAAVTNAKLRNSTGLSVIGRSANSTGSPADIVASLDGQVLRRDGTTLGFGALDLASANALTGILGVTSGGTGTGTAFTPGSVVFAGASGVYSQDNANFFWDNTNKRFGIGTATPTSSFHVGGISNTSTFDGNVVFGGGGFSYTQATNITAVDNLALGAITFDTDAGIVSWIDMPVSNVPSAGTIMSYTAQLDGNPLLTIYGEADGTGGVQNIGVGIGTTTPTNMLSVGGGADFGGSVGIGTSSPAHNLHVFGSANQNLQVESSSGTADLSLRSNTTDFKLSLSGSTALFAGGSGDGVGLLFNASDVSDQLSLATSGNVGVGTSSPSEKLHVVGNSLFAGNVRLNASSYLNFGATSGTSGYGFRDNAGTLEYKNSGGTWATFSAGGSVTSVGTGTGLTGGPITTTGTIALTGQALALHNLGTNGLIARTGSGTVAGRTITGGTGLSVTNGNGVSGNPSISLATTGNGAPFVQGGNSFGAIAQLGTNDNQPLVFRTNNSESMRVLANGNVGLGTTTPAYRLDVSGGTGIVGRFSGRVIGANAVNNDEFTTLGQVTGAIGSASHDPVTLTGQNYLTLSNQQITANAINISGSHVTGTLPIASGGTGATTAGTALSNLGGVPTARTITAGTGLTGGGDLSANRTLSVSFGAAAGTVAQGNDSRILNGQTAFSWGNHADAGYLTTELDPTVPAHVKAITAGNISNWNTAFSWGNHATAGYLSQSAIDTSAKIAGIVGDETGTGSLVFNTNPTFADSLTLNNGSLLVTGTHGGGNGITVTGDGTRMFFDTNKSAFRAGSVNSSPGWPRDDVWNDANVGNYSIALGRNTIASGESSVAFGSHNTASGNNSTAFGYFTTASNTYSTAFGNDTLASGSNSTAFGYDTTASNTYSTAFGYWNESSGYASTAFGNRTNASGYTATAFGRATTATGDYSTAFGQSTTAQAYNSVALGRYNVIAGSTFSWVDTDPLFVIGNGTSTSNRSNAMTVLKNGNVGLGGEYLNFGASAGTGIGSAGYGFRDNSGVIEVKNSGGTWAPLGAGASAYLALTDTPSTFTTNAVPYTNSGGTALAHSSNFTYDGTTFSVAGTGFQASSAGARASAGSVSTPSFSFTGDTDTGMYNPSANSLSFTTGGVERLNIDNNGGVSVNGGYVYGDASQAYIRLSSVAGSYLNYGVDGDTSNVQVGYNSIVFRTANTVRMRIESDGTVAVLNNFSIDSDRVLYDSTRKVLSVENLELGPVRFEENAGYVSWIDMDVTSTAASGSVMAYAAQLDGNSLLTVYGQSNGAGGIQRTRVAVGDVSSTVLNSPNLPNGSLIVGNGALCVDDGGDRCDNASRTAGQLYARNATVTAIDVAETFPTKDQDLQPAEIMMFDPENPVFVRRYSRANFDSIVDRIKQEVENELIEDDLDELPNAPTIAGIYSTNPGLLLGGFNDELYKEEKKVALALSGRVPLKVNLEGGDIRPGDRIAISNVPGVGRKADSSGWIVGVALEPFNEEIADEIASEAEQELADISDLSIKNVNLFEDETRGAIENELTEKKALKPEGSVSVLSENDEIESKLEKASIEGVIQVLVDTSYYQTESGPYVAKNGNVGIGTKSPEYKLHVAGEVGANGFVIKTINGENAKSVDYVTAAESLSILDQIREVKIARYALEREVGNGETQTDYRFGFLAEDVPSQILSAKGSGIDIESFVAYSLSGLQALTQKVDAIELRVADLESASGGLLPQIGAGINRIASLAVGNLTVGSSTKPSGITIFDKETGNPYCVVVINGKVETQPGECTTTTPTPPSTPTQPPATEDPEEPEKTIPTDDEDWGEVDPVEPTDDKVNDESGGEKVADSDE